MYGMLRVFVPLRAGGKPDLYVNPVCIQDRIKYFSQYLSDLEE